MSVACFFAEEDAPFFGFFYKNRRPYIQRLSLLHAQMQGVGETGDNCNGFWKIEPNSL